jgi:hypothetical protein
MKEPVPQPVHLPAAVSQQRKASVLASIRRSRWLLFAGFVVAKLLEWNAPGGSGIALFLLIAGLLTFPASAALDENERRFFAQRWLVIWTGGMNIFLTLMSSLLVIVVSVAAIGNGYPICLLARGFWLLAQCFWLQTALYLLYGGSTALTNLLLIICLGPAVVCTFHITANKQLSLFHKMVWLSLHITSMVMLCPLPAVVYGHQWLRSKSVKLLSAPASGGN